MSVSKDGSTGRWMAQLRVTDWQGKVHHRKKRGFLTKHEALDWERSILSTKQSAPGMSFAQLANVYFEDVSHRLKPSTLDSKHYIIDLKITPFFASTPISDISPAMIRAWQNTITDSRDKFGKPYSPTYIGAISKQLTAILNYAEKYYDLPENPCHRAGSIGTSRSHEMQFWTRDEFVKFIAAVKQPEKSAAFQTLYLTGMRVGELLALTPEDIDLSALTIKIDKTYQRLGKKIIISTPKTIKSNRVITIPKILANTLAEHLRATSPAPGDRVFPESKQSLRYALNKACEASGVKRIRIHDLRHSHASLLIELGFQPLLIADRLGHDKIQTTLNTYSHLYPNKQAEVAACLDTIF